jgi:glycerophosphoryl diester phosphodiesterase
MDYSEIKQFDVGSLGNKDFPQQVRMKVYKPLLSEVFREAAKYAKKHKLRPVRFNIEIKSNPQWDGIFAPTPAVFAKMVNDAIITSEMEKQVIVQCFDERPLQELNKMGVKYPIALLVSNPLGVEKNLERLGFKPDTYSPHFSMVNQESVDILKKKGIKIVPWTVNEIADLEKMKKFALDGIITDYPDRAVKVFKN